MCSIRGQKLPGFGENCADILLMCWGPLHRWASRGRREEPEEQARSPQRGSPTLGGLDSAQNWANAGSWIRPAQGLLLRRNKKRFWHRVSSKSELCGADSGHVFGPYFPVWGLTAKVPRSTEIGSELAWIRPNLERSGPALALDLGPKVGSTSRESNVPAFDRRSARNLPHSLGGRVGRVACVCPDSTEGLPPMRPMLGSIYSAGACVRFGRMLG